MKKLGNYSQSIKYFNKAIAVSGGTAGKSFYYRGVCEVSTGKKEQGYSSIKTAIAKGFQGDVNYNKTNCNF